MINSQVASEASSVYITGITRIGTFLTFVIAVLEVIVNAIATMWRGRSHQLPKESRIARSAISGIQTSKTVISARLA